MRLGILIPEALLVTGGTSTLTNVNVAPLAAALMLGV